MSIPALSSEGPAAPAGMPGQGDHGPGSGTGAGAEILVLMAICDGERFLPAQLASIAAQRDVDWRLRVLDDASRDGSRACVETFAADQPPGRVTLVAAPAGHLPRQGSAAAFLALLHHPDLEVGPLTHIAFADQDDIWHPRKLARALACLQAAQAVQAAGAGGGAGPRPRVYGARVRPFVTDTGPGAGPGAGLPSGPPLADPHLCGPPGQTGRLPLAMAVARNLVGGHSMVLDPAAVALVRALKPPAGVGFHDWWLTLAVLAAGGEALLDPAVVLDYRQHAGNAQGVAVTSWSGVTGRSFLRRALGAGGPGHAMARRLRQIVRGDYRRWIDANLVGILDWARADDLPSAAETPPQTLGRQAATPEALRIATALAGTAAPRGGLTRLKAMRRLGIRREGRAGTALLRLLALLGLA